MINYSFEGLDKIEENLTVLAGRIGKFNLAATTENLKDLKQRSVKKAPYKQGSLKRSIEYEITTANNEQVVGDVGSRLPYALIQEVGGTIPAHSVNPKNRNSLAWYDPKSQYAAKSGKYKGWVFSKSSNIPTIRIKAQPYLFPSLIEGIETFLGRYREAWEAANK